MGREQVGFPESQPSTTEGLTTCEWVILAELEVTEYLKDQGPDTLRVALKVGSGPQPDRPLVRVESGQDIVVGLEYVLFLGNRRFPDT